MRFALALVLSIASTSLPAQQTTPPPAGAPAAQQPTPRRPRPYAQVITDKAVTDAGAITVHRVDERWFFEVPDSLARRDFLFVSRIAGVPANFGGFTSAGSSVEERVIRWERQGERLLMRALDFTSYADDSLPIAISVASNNVGAIIASFPIQAFGRDSATFVIDVTDFFAGDTPGISGLSPAQRRQYQVRRLDPARSFINNVKSFPQNIEVRHTQTFEAGEPPSDQTSASITLEMRQSVVLLPREPMRPRYADERIGFFSVRRVNYGLDEQKAASQEFIRRWRMEPKDPAAYARGELVEPVKPIVYYIDPATPTKWRRYVREGVENWQQVFEKAGFKNAILVKDPPSPREDPDWDPEDIRYSVVRWAASLVRNAVGPSTSDPRTGEIIESDITWYHNHMRSYRNRLLIETSAANPVARTLEMPEELMGETMRQVITHEVGHALGLPHNMVASSFFPVDSLRKPSFASKYGVSATIMDYARQNYVAQPGDGLAPKDFIRRLGPFDDFVINWGYRALPQAATPEAERAILNRMYMSQTGPMQYRYVPQQLGALDPRSQTEDIGDDPIRASTFAIANLQRVLPNLVQWTTTPGESYDELQELYGETLGMWSLYMGHVTTIIGGMNVEAKTADQSGAVYASIPKARQKAALQFLTEHVIRTPSWLTPSEIVSRVGPLPVNGSLTGRQSAVVVQLLDTRRLARLADMEARDVATAYGLAEYMSDLRRAVFEAPAVSTSPDAAQRTMQRVFLERLDALITPPPPPAAPAVPGAGGGGGQQLPPLLALPNVPRSDLPALARRTARTVGAFAARQAVAGRSPLLRAHWEDLAARVDKMLDTKR